MRVTVQWDFELDDDTDWNALSYEEKHVQADIPEVIELPEQIVKGYQELMLEGDEFDAEYLVGEWLSDEFGWLHYGWQVE